MKVGTEIKFGNNPDPNVRFLWVDRNKDGSITFDEFSFVFGKRWTSSILDKIATTIITMKTKYYDQIFLFL